jgi:hypothetical protein
MKGIHFALFVLPEEIWRVLTNVLNGLLEINFQWCSEA